MRRSCAGAPESAPRSSDLAGLAAAVAECRRPAAPVVGLAPARGGGAAQQGARSLHARTGGRRGADHAARRSRFAAGGSFRQRARARVADGADRRQLGSPVEQVDPAPRAAADHGVERHAEAGGDRSARRARRAHHRDRRAVLRPVVRPAAVPVPRGVLRAHRPRSGTAVRALRLLVAVPQDRRRGAVRRALDPGGARQRRSGAARHRHPGAAAPGAARRVAAEST